MLHEAHEHHLDFQTLQLRFCLYLRKIPKYCYENRNNVISSNTLQIHTNKYIKHVTRKPTTTSMRKKVIARTRTFLNLECLCWTIKDQDKAGDEQ